MMNRPMMNRPMMNRPMINRPMMNRSMMNRPMMSRPMINGNVRRKLGNYLISNCPARSIVEERRERTSWLVTY